MRPLIFALFLSLAWVGLSSDISAQRLEPVVRTPGHSEIVAIAVELVRSRSNRLDPKDKPLIYFCGKGHLHWRVAPYSRLELDSFALDQRVQIERFWKELPPNSRQLWEPYIREIDGLIADFIGTASRDDPDLRSNQEQQYRRWIHDVYRSGFDEYARRTNTTPIEEDGEPELCCAAPSLEVALISNVRGVASIEWIDAGTVWLNLSLTGNEPQYHVCSPGTRVMVAPGAWYYYRLVLRDGRTSRRLLAPEISGNASQVVLSWR